VGARWERQDGKTEVDVSHDPEAGLSSATRTWQDDSWSYTGKVSGWTTYSADEKLGYVYLPLKHRRT